MFLRSIIIFILIISLGACSKKEPVYVQEDIKDPSNYIKKLLLHFKRMISFLQIKNF